MSGEHCCRGRFEMHVCSAAVAEVGKDSGMTKVCVSKPEVSCSNLYLLSKTGPCALDRPQRSFVHAVRGTRPYPTRGRIFPT